MEKQIKRIRSRRQVINMLKHERIYRESYMPTYESITLAKVLDNYDAHKDFNKLAADIEVEIIVARDKTQIMNRDNDMIAMFNFVEFLENMLEKIKEIKAKEITAA